MSDAIRWNKIEATKVFSYTLDVAVMANCVDGRVIAGTWISVQLVYRWTGMYRQVYRWTGKHGWASSYLFLHGCLSSCGLEYVWYQSEIPESEIA